MVRLSVAFFIHERSNYIMKKLLEEHPCAGSFMGCCITFAGVLGLKIVTDFVFNMAVLLIDHNKNCGKTREVSTDDDGYFEEE